MSGSMAADDPDDAVFVLAGEYVLGTLSREEADRIAFEAESDPVLAGEIVAWERELTPLLLLVQPVTPPLTLWPRILASVHGAGVMPLTGDRRIVTSLGLWRGVAAASLLAAGIAGLALLDRHPVPTAVPVAVLTPIGTAQAAFVMEAQQDGSLSIVSIHPAAVPSGRDLELWSLAEGAKIPKPLGVLPAGGLHLAADQLPPGRAQILVSLEPQSGSPTGQPTGPVLYGAALIRPE